VGLFLFVADKAGDLTAGTRYAARWMQTSGEGVGAADLDWVKLGQATSDEIRGLIDGGITFDDIFDSTTLDVTPDWKDKGFRMISAGHMDNELLKLEPGMEQAAAFLEGRRYAAYLGATTEFNKMEGAALDPREKHLYLAMSYIEEGMQKNETGPADHIQVNNLKAGGVYQIVLAGGRKDTSGEAIDSDWVGTSMHAPAKLTGEDIPNDALGNIANPDKIANPDNLFFSGKMRTLFIGEDSGTHVNNAVWAYNVDTDKLTRILSLASGAESTGLQVVENINGHAYIMSNAQHQGEWIKTMPDDVKARLSAAAEAAYGKNAKGAQNYRLEAPVGYISGIPGL
jgi:secreted PhoX family phosphatase